MIEYYDELYPVSKGQKDFFNNLFTSYKMPTRFLGIGCGTGSFEHDLALLGHDVTGTDTSAEMLESANRRRRMPNTAIRFFLMSTVEMTRFLGSSFYNCIACLNSKIILIHDQTLLRKFFFDCKSLLSENGTLVLQLGNFTLLEDTNTFTLPVQKSIRASLHSTLEETEDEKYLLTQTIDRGDNRFLPILDKAPIQPITPDIINTYAKEAGFSTITYYNGWTQEPFTGEDANIVCLLS
ncbi:MAG TPA: class I SAM-dependent methyltransferase [Treponemataceae bacterium]|nr:class I SAM-dependent methyltransferase [Treponemataceae bacterium]